MFTPLAVCGKLAWEILGRWGQGSTRPGWATWVGAGVLQHRRIEHSPGCASPSPFSEASERLHPLGQLAGGIAEPQAGGLLAERGAIPGAALVIDGAAQVDHAAGPGRLGLGGIGGGDVGDAGGFSPGRGRLGGGRGRGKDGGRGGRGPQSFRNMTRFP